VFLPILGKNLYARLKLRRAFEISYALGEPVFRFANRFSPLGQNAHEVQVRSTLLRRVALPIISVFFFSVHFSFFVAIKKKSEQRKIHLSINSYNINYV
jgi:hypothetical protein